MSMLVKISIFNKCEKRPISQHSGRQVSGDVSFTLICHAFHFSYQDSDSFMLNSPFSLYISANPGFSRYNALCISTCQYHTTLVIFDVCSISFSNFSTISFVLGSSPAFINIYRRVR